MPRLLQTERLILRQWTEADLPAFAELNTDPDVSRDLGGPMRPGDSDRKLRSYADTIERLGFGRWAVERAGGAGKQKFLGYAGVMPVGDDHPLGEHYEVGWRLRRSAWGFGYATEAAQAALSDAFERTDLDEILSYTATDNDRSQAVMNRLGLRRDSTRDFVKHYDELGHWTGLVWVATGGDFLSNTVRP